MKNQLSIIIVNYNKYQLTQKCIESISKNIYDIEYEIIVVDNCSPNESFNELLKMNFNNKNIKVIRNDVNNGFGYGNNKGVEMSKYENILLLNPDVIVLENSINKMLNRLLDDTSIGIIGCKLLNKDYSLQYSCRRILSFKDFIMARTPIKNIFNNKKINEVNEKYLMLDYDHKSEREVDWLMGSCLMLRKKDFWAVDGFSEEYFMYFEDVDLAYKLKRIGKKIIYYPKVSMIHLHEQESVKRINKLTYIHFISMIKFYKKILFNNIFL